MKHRMNGLNFRLSSLPAKHSSFKRPDFSQNPYTQQHYFEHHYKITLRSWPDIFSFL